MDWFLLTPESTRTLSLVILNLAITLYLVRIREKLDATWWLATFTGGIVVFYSMRFIEASVFPLEASSTLGRVRILTEFLVVPVALGAFMQFAYRFIEHPFRREARVLLALTGVLFAGLAVYAAFVLLGGRDVQSFYILYSLVWLVFCTWSSVVLVRKSRRLRRRVPADAPGGPVQRRRRAYRAFAGLSALLAVILVAILLQIGVGVLPEVMWAVVILPGVFVFFSGLVVVYVNHAREPTTFQVKLVGLSLATTLAVLGMVAVLLYPPGGMVRESGVFPPNGQSLRFAPVPSGGYRVTAASPDVEESIGEPLDLRDRAATTIPLGFAFPFFGTQWDSATVSLRGAVFFGSAGTPPGGAGSLRDPRGTPPQIVPLSGLGRVSHRSNTQVPDVFLRRTPGRIVLTWHFPAMPNTSTSATTRLVLDDDGTIYFAYDDLAGVAAQQSETLRETLSGLSPGGAAPRLVPRALSAGVPFVLPAGTGAIDDLGRRVRVYTHVRSIRLLGLLLAATLFILLVFPFVFRAGMLHPLERLLAGVRRVNAGERDVEVPVRVRDEIGVLTEHFNAMTRSLRDAEAELRAYAEELEARVAERTAALEASTAQLAEQARRLRELDELKTRFFANISHEFRTPLTLLLGPLQDHLDGRTDADGLARHAPVMHRNARRLLGLINQLLDLAKLGAGSMDLRAQRTDLVAFLRALVLAFAARAEREGLTLLFDAQEERLGGCVDRDKLEKVVANLLSNAFKFTASGGKVRLGVAAVEGASVEGASGDGEAGGHVEIVVEDTGRGIPASELPHLFDRFHQVDGSSTRDQEGTGIGLALAKELVELHGGTIDVASKVGFGSTFTVRLPLREPRAALEEDARPGPAALPADRDETAHRPVVVPPSETDEARAGGDVSAPAPAGRRSPEVPTVLVVEDNPDMRAFLCEYLEPDYDVVAARDGVEGLERARVVRPALVISDVMMPRMDGFSLCRALKTDGSLNHIPVVLLTARADEESKLEGLETGADDYLAKPFNADELLARAENLIAVRRTLRERFSGEVVVEPSAVVVPSAEAAWLETVRTVVEAHLGDSGFTVERMADEVGLSKRQLQRKLKAATSLSPSGFIRTMRLERAAQLLEQKAGTVSETAYAVGFNDAEYFSKLFRQVFGVVPSEYARTLSRNDDRGS